MHNCRQLSSSAKSIFLSKGEAKRRTVRNSWCSDIRSYNILSVGTLFCKLAAENVKVRRPLGHSWKGGKVSYMTA